MKILTHGKLNRGFEGEWECHRCGCRWEMDAHDMPPQFHSDQRDGDFFQMDCPNCKQTTTRYDARGNR